MKKFEYKRIRIAPDQFEEILNDLGKDGWQLIQYDSGYAYIMKEIPFIVKSNAKQLLQESYNHED